MHVNLAQQGATLLAEDRRCGRKVATPLLKYQYERTATVVAVAAER
jgi:hypothetical protein